MGLNAWAGDLACEHARQAAGTPAAAPRKLYDLMGESVDGAPATGAAAAEGTAALHTFRPSSWPHDGERVTRRAVCVAHTAAKAVSKTAQKNKKRKEKTKGSGDAGGDDDADDSSAAPAAAATVVPTAWDRPEPEDPETAKKIKSVQKKLKQIEQLREQQAQGKPLEANQVDKIKGEPALRKELEDLLKL